MTVRAHAAACPGRAALLRYRGALRASSGEHRQGRGILELYERLKLETLPLTRSRSAVPLLDQLCRQPIFVPSSLLALDDMTSKPMVMQLLAKLRLLAF